MKTKIKHKNAGIEFEIKNNAGELFKFFIDEENRLRIDVKYGKELMAAIIMSKNDAEGLTEFLHEINDKLQS